MKMLGRGLAALFLFFGALSAPAGAAVVDRIVAVVNDEVITFSDLNEELDVIRQRTAATYKGQDIERLLAEARPHVLNRMVDRLLIGQEARKSGIVLKDEEVNEAIRDGLAQRKMRIEDLIASLAKEGVTLEEYRRELRDHLMKTKLVRREIRSKIMISDDEIGAYYQKHRDDYEGRETVRIQQILLPMPKNADEGQIRTIRQEAEAIRQRLKEGEAFELLAGRYSQGPAAAGGDIGFVEKGVMLPEVEAVAFNLKIGEISDVISSPVGFHIIRVTDKRGAGLKPIEAVREEIRRKIEDEKADKRYESWIEDLRKKSHIEIR
ncbi:MAG: peptidylprolyl isomerase [Syntrophales bacterium]|jgi:parvulin-like peptidyl-prolyl isomerase|nr:peptidylprolyl isomerase [Syntrophales bacterium]